MSRGGLSSVRCVPAAVTAQAVCVLFIFLASSLSSLQNVTASRLPLSRDSRNDNSARFSLAEDKAARGATPGGGGSGTKPAVLATAPAPAGKPQTGGKAAETPPSTAGEKKEASPSPTTPKAEVDPGKKADETPAKPAATPTGAQPSDSPAPAPAASGTEGAAGAQEGKAKETPAAGTPAAGTPAGSTSPAGSTDQPPAQGPGPVAPSPRATQTSPSPNTSTPGSGSSTTTTDGKGDGAYALRAPVSATLALVLFGCALTIL